MERAADDEFLKGFQYFRAARRLETRATQEEYAVAVVLFGLAHEFRERANALMQSGEGAAFLGESGAAPSFGEAGSDRRR